MTSVRGIVMFRLLMMAANYLCHLAALLINCWRLFHCKGSFQQLSILSAKPSDYLKAQQAAAVSLVLRNSVKLNCPPASVVLVLFLACLLYTSDAADE